MANLSPEAGMKLIDGNGERGIIVAFKWSLPALLMPIYQTPTLRRADYIREGQRRRYLGAATIELGF
jgi:hypothetical protein